MNVVLIIIDTLRPDHLGCYADTYPYPPRAKTPNLDRLAAESLRFGAAYPECLPTIPARRAIHTGQRVWPFHGWVDLKGNNPIDTQGAAPRWGPMHNEQETLAEQLVVNGYRTAFITDVYHQFKANRNFHRGFQEWRWIRGQETDPYRTGPALPDEFVLHHIAEKLRDNASFVDVHRRYLTNVADRQGEEDYFPARVFREGANWLWRNQDAEKFLLVIDSFDPHEPWDPPDYYRRMYEPDNPDVANVIWAPYTRADKYFTPAELTRAHANYAGEVTMVDRWIGHFLDAFEATGRADDTLLMLVSDHGHYLGDHNLTGKMGYPLCREVADLVMMIRHPEGARAGEATDQLVWHCDLTATAIDAAGLTPTQPLDGQSLLPGFEGERNLPDREHVLFGWGPFVVIRTKKWWYNATLWGEKALLFDLEKDPTLQRSVADKHADVIEQMKQLTMRECNNDYPSYLREHADAALPGCTPLVQWAVS